MKRRQSGKRARSRVIIMDAARKLFEEKGIGHVTFNDIAAEAHMCRTTIFNHFANVNELLYALVEASVVEMETEYKNGDKRGVEAIEALFQRLFRNTAEYPVLNSKLVSNALIRDDEKSQLSRVEAIIRDNLPECPAEELNDRVVAISGLYFGLVNHYFINKKEFDADEMYRRFRDLAAPYLK